MTSPVGRPRPERIMWYAPRSPLMVGRKFDTTTSPASVSATSLPTSSGGSGTQPRHASWATLPVPTRSNSSTASRASCPTTATCTSPRTGVCTDAMPCGAKRSAGGGAVQAGSPAGGPLPTSCAGSPVGQSGRGAVSGGTRATSPPPAPSRPRISLTMSKPAAGTASMSSGFVNPQIVPSVPSRGTGWHASRGRPPHPRATSSPSSMVTRRVASTCRQEHIFRSPPTDARGTPWDSHRLGGHMANRWMRVIGLLILCATPPAAVGAEPLCPGGEGTLGPGTLRAIPSRSGAGRVRSTHASFVLPTGIAIAPESQPVVFAIEGDRQPIGKVTLDAGDLVSFRGGKHFAYRGRGARLSLGHGRGGYRVAVDIDGFDLTALDLTHPPRFMKQVLKIGDACFSSVLA